MSDRVDAHCHLRAPARGNYGWFDPSDPALIPIARDFDVADLRAADSAADGRARIVAQAAPTVAETVYLLGLADTTAEIAGVVGWVDLSSQNAAATLERLADHAAFEGARPMLQYIPEIDWINTRPRAEADATLLEHDPSVDALVLPQHLAALLDFASAYPDLRIVIDHAAKPALAADRSASVTAEDRQKIRSSTDRGFYRLGGAG